MCPWSLIAHDLSPADMLQFKQSVFARFITDVGGEDLAHGHRGAQHGLARLWWARDWPANLVRQDDGWVVIDGDAGVVIDRPLAHLILASAASPGSNAGARLETRASAAPLLCIRAAVTLDGRT